MKSLPIDLVTSGRFNFGRYDAPFRTINPLDAQPHRVPLPRRVRDARLKEWQAFQFANDRFFANVALFNAKVLALVQIKVFDRVTGTKHLFEKRLPGWAFRAPTTLLDSEMAWRSRRGSMRFRNRLTDDHIDIEFDVAAHRKTPRMRGRLRALFTGQEPLVVAIPFGDNRGMYSHKGVVPLEGTLEVADQTTTFGPGNGYLLMDDHRGYYPAVMRWDWLTSGRYTADGKLFGFNLTRNDSIDPEQYNENAFWLDGVAHRLPAVTFARGHRGADEVWSVRDRQGRVEVDFKVEVPGRVDINAGLIRSKYRGPFGTCSGRLVAEDGSEHSVDGMFGMVEDFYLRA